MSGFETENTLENILDECCKETQNMNNPEQDDGISDDSISDDVCRNNEDKNEDEDEDEDDNVIELTFNDLVLVINDKYFDYLNKINIIFKNHNILSKSIKHDIEYLNEKLETNPSAVLLTITDNYLYCLEQIKDKNADFFKYQKESIIKKKRWFER